jgi:hypothetical protein
MDEQLLLSDFIEVPGTASTPKKDELYKDA